MKKFKEFLYFPLITVLLIIIFFGLFILTNPNNSYSGNLEYLTYMLSQDYFSTLLYTTFFVPYLISLAATFISNLVMFFLKFVAKKNIERKNFYYVMPVVTVIITLGIFYFFTDAFVGLTNVSLSTQTAMYTLIFAMIVATFVTFSYWVIELITYLISKIANKKN